MTLPERAAEARQQAEHSAAGPAAELIERLAARLGSWASVSAVYGEPVERDGVTVIAVARVRFGFGGGAGLGHKEGEGGGGGGGAEAAPLGYIEIKDGGAAFTPIRDPLPRLAVRLAFAAAAGSAAPRIIRALRRRRR